MKDKILILLIVMLILTGIISFSLMISNKHKNKKDCISKTVVIEKEEKASPDWNYENILLLGDSITEIYPVEEIFGDLPIVKSGVSGYTTNDILNQMNSMVYQYNPTKIFLLIGTNDIMNDNDQKTIDSVIKNIKEIVKESKKNRTKAKIYIESIYPVNRNMKKDMVAERRNETIIEINTLLKKYCKENKITYIDMFDELTDNEGNFDEQYTYDGLHPNTLGYAKISHILTRYIYE